MLKRRTIISIACALLTVAVVGTIIYMLNGRQTYTMSELEALNLTGKNTVEVIDLMGKPDSHLSDSDSERIEFIYRDILIDPNKNEKGGVKLIFHNGRVRFIYALYR
jgi:hypothetical protein